jgi:hypothetical protein
MNFEFPTTLPERNVGGQRELKIQNSKFKIDKRTVEQLGLLDAIRWSR